MFVTHEDNTIQYEDTKLVVEILGAICINTGGKDEKKYSSCVSSVK